MKIASSDITMSSSHELESSVAVKKTSLAVKASEGAKVKNAVAAIYDGSGKSMTEALETYRGARERAEAARQGPAAQPTPCESCCVQLSAIDVSVDFAFSETSDLKVQLLDRLLAALNGKGRHEPIRIAGMDKGTVLDLRGPAAREAGVRSQLFGSSAFSFSASISAVSATVRAGAVRGAPSRGGPAVGTSAEGTLWQRVTATSAERTEREHTAFQSRGLAVTEDGRSIGFDVEFAMDRSFTAKYDSLTSEEFIMTDPLIINLNGGTASVSDVKFKFDLDCDGKEDEISFAGGGNGFLALDRDGNGAIDDGSELFGAKSGDGFADLAAYDTDGNHWIDENDPVYSQLRVWVRDDGGDRLLSLKEADVGAIYLGSVSTEFSLKSAETNETNAVIRKTGVFLHESGEVGTLSHVDLVS